MRGYHFRAGEDLTADKLNWGELVTCATLTTNVGPINSTTEVALITTSSITLKNGRCYEFVLRGLLQHASASATDICFLRLRRTSTVGPLIRNLGNVLVYNGASANRNASVDLSHIAVNASGADITGVVVATASWDIGSSRTFTFAATAGTPATLCIYDLGPSAEFPNVGVIV